MENEDSFSPLRFGFQGHNKGKKETKKQSTYCNNLLKRANLPSLYNKRLQDIVIFMFKVKHKLLPKNNLDFFSETPSNYHLRNSDFYITRFNSVRHGKHSLTFFGPQLWSKLSPGDSERQTLKAVMANIRKRDLASLLENDFF